MQYCSIEEAWKDPLMKETKKKKKQKKLYSSKIPKYIEDTSYLEGGHDYHCATQEEPNFSTNLPSLGNLLSATTILYIGLFLTPPIDNLILSILILSF